MTDAATDLRCATWSRTAALDPVGTAGAYRGYLVVDLALPWPRDIAELDEVAAIVPHLHGTGIRVQARVPVGPRRAALYRFAGDGDPVMAGREVAVGDEPGDLEVATRSLLAGDGEPVDPDRRQVLLCTHGRRDLCCGSRGAALDVQLSGGDGLGVPGVTVRRTSHTGGHRFAPTAIVLPEATSWAYLDAGRLRRVIERTGPVAELLDGYRGWSGAGEPALQALERAVLAEEGWGLLDRRRQGSQVGDDRWALAVTGDGGATTWEAEIRPGRRVPRPDCGQPLESSAKHDVELVVTGLRSSRP